MAESGNTVDFVICWVDGNDPAWRSEKAKYAPSKNDDTRAVRYRDWDNLQYWFRAVEQFTPWVNKVHFVTWGHLPKWLNTDHPKLHIVKHSDYIPMQYLPTFCSRPIETNIHRIPGLAERFVYFNDDMFVIRPMPITDFFVNGVPTDFAITSTISTSTINDDGPFIKMNNISILNTSFDKKQQMKKSFSKWVNIAYGADALRNLVFFGQHRFKGLSNNHLPFSYYKHTFEEVWANYFDILDTTCLHKYRNKLDVNQWLFRYWQLAKGDFVPVGRNYKGKVYEVYGDVAGNHRLFDIIEKQKYRMVCINDNDDIDFDGIKARLNQAFSRILPHKSSYERA